MKQQRYELREKLDIVDALLRSGGHLVEFKKSVSTQTWMMSILPEPKPNLKKKEEYSELDTRTKFKLFTDQELCFLISDETLKIQ